MDINGSKNIFSIIKDWVTGSDSKAHLHGSARFAEFDEIKKMGLLKNSGVYIGGVEQHGINNYLRHNGPEHILAIAPTRSGKGVGLVLPTLLSWKESAIILDIKGENWALTSGWRTEYAKNICYRFDVTNPDSAKFNPLEEVRWNTDKEISDAQNIAAMIVDPSGTGMDDHWSESAFNLIAASIIHCCYVERDLNRIPSIAGVLELLTDPEKPINIVLEDMMKTCHKNKAPHPFVARISRDLLNKSENERSGVISTTTTKLSLYHDNIVSQITSKSDFRIRDLMNNEQPVSLYLVVPPSDAARVIPLLRLIINQIMRTLTEKMDFENGESVKHYKHRLLLMIDEFPSLGKLEIFEKSLAFIAGYGLKAYLIIQDLSQLYKAYGKDESITSNCHVQIVYALNKIESAEAVSRMLGKTTVAHRVVSQSQSHGIFKMSQKSESFQHTERPLMTADEVRTLPGPEKNSEGKITKAGDMLIFISGQRPIYGKQILYFLDPYFLKAAKIKPVTDRPLIEKSRVSELSLDQLEYSTPNLHVNKLGVSSVAKTKEFGKKEITNCENKTFSHSSNNPAPDINNSENEPPDI